ncbi:hypothetical protein K7432_004247 [Basidiobolus ranarum]|uniref:CCHC-type domain-containing protein n=1 Tax=Basidiobolus ranarum TaxID=34480 RepID=A0ABR2WYK7_9FUNG
MYEEYDYDAHRQYEDDMYQSDHTDASGEKVDSDIEDTLLSHVYYTPKSQKTTPAKSVVSEEFDATPSKASKFSQVISSDENDSDNEHHNVSHSDEESDTKYTLSKKNKNTEVMTNDDSSTDSDSSLDWEEEASKDNIKEKIAMDEHDSVEPDTEKNEKTPNKMSNSNIQLTEPLLITQVITPNKKWSPEPQSESAKVSDDEYEYLEDADIKGKNRYFMEPDSGKKGQVCYICKEPGHLARDCTVLKCFICGEEGHTSRDCLFTSEICHNCNKRGHRARDCPEPRSFGVKECRRCESRNHHSEECPLIWRQYVIAKPNPAKIKPDRMFCYNCGDYGHLGNKCSKSNMDQSSGSGAFNNSHQNSRNSRGRPEEDRRPAKRYRADFHDDHRHKYDDRDRHRSYGRESSYRRDRHYDNGHRRESSYTPRDKYRSRDSDYRQSPSYKKSSPSYRHDKKRRR